MGRKRKEGKFYEIKALKNKYYYEIETGRIFREHRRVLIKVAIENSLEEALCKIKRALEKIYDYKGKEIKISCKKLSLSKSRLLESKIFRKGGMKNGV